MWSLGDSNNTVKRRKLPITSTVTSNNVSTIPEGRRSTTHTILRRNGINGTRESPRLNTVAGPRESLRLNSNREVTRTGSLIGATSTQPLVIQGDPILISDDDSDDSDIQVIHT